jgi:hypothetical protein
MIGRFFIIVGCSFLLACGQDTNVPHGNTQIDTNAVPVALQNTNTTSSSKSYRQGDLVEELYEEILKNNTSLQALNDSIIYCQQHKGDSNILFFNYDRKSNDYYSSAKSLIANINDSVLAKNMLVALTESEERYTQKKITLTTLLNAIESKDKLISDKRIVLKIKRTLSQIEKFQDRNKPNSYPFQQIIKTQEQLLSKLDSTLKD